MSGRKVVIPCPNRSHSRQVTSRLSSEKDHFHRTKPMSHCIQVHQLTISQQIQFNNTWPLWCLEVDSNRHGDQGPGQYHWNQQPMILLCWETGTAFRRVVVEFPQGRLVRCWLRVQGTS